jgi:hypothetical protein
MKMMVIAGNHSRSFDVDPELKGLDAALQNCANLVGHENFQLMLCRENITYVLNWRSRVRRYPNRSGADNSGT